MSTSNIFSNVYIYGNCSVKGTLTASDSLMFRNRLINGAMNVWQRGTGATSTAASAYSTVDRWCGALGTTNLTLSQSSTVPANTGFQNSLQIATSTSTASTPLIEQRIEYLNVTDFLSGTTVTVSFWASQTAGTLMPLSVGLYYATAQNNFASQTLAVAAAQTTPTLTGTMAFYTLTFVLTSSSGAANGLSLRFTTGATASSGTFLLTGVQLEKGGVASPFEYKPYSFELLSCQRYYYQLTSPVPGSTGVASQVYAYFATATGISSTGFWFPLTFPVTMRYPSYTVSNSAASNWQIYNGSTLPVTAISTQTDSYTTNGIIFNCSVASGATAGNSYILRTSGLTGSTTAYIGVSCEL
jgi:hypothetical protein